MRGSHPHSEDSRLFFLPGTVQGSFPLSKWMQRITSVSRWKIWLPSLLCSQTTKQQLWWKSVDCPGCHQPRHDSGDHDMRQVARPATSNTAELSVYQNWEKQHFLFQFSNYSQFTMERRRWRTKGAKVLCPYPATSFQAVWERTRWQFPGSTGLKWKSYLLTLSLFESKLQSQNGDFTEATE